MAEVGIPNITITTHMWIIWGQAAIVAAQRAAVARSDAIRSQSNHGRAGLSDALGTETRESLLAVCSSAFAVDALMGTLQRAVMPPDIVTKWESGDGRRGKAVDRIGEVLKRSTNSKTAQELAERWESVLSARGEAAHFLERPGIPEPHPLGTNVSPEDAKYRTETAKAAVDLLLDTLDAIHGSPSKAAIEWARTYGDAIRALSSFSNYRSAGPST